MRGDGRPSRTLACKGLEELSKGGKEGGREQNNAKGQERTFKTKSNRSGRHDWEGAKTTILWRLNNVKTRTHIDKHANKHEHDGPSNLITRRPSPLGFPDTARRTLWTNLFALCISSMPFAHALPAYMSMHAHACACMSMHAHVHRIAFEPSRAPNRLAKSRELPSESNQASALMHNSGIAPRGVQ